MVENPGKIILGASLTADLAIVVTTASIEVADAANLELLKPNPDLSKGLNALVMLSNYTQPSRTKERSTKGLLVGYVLSF